MPVTPKHPLIFQCPMCRALVPLHDFSTTDKGLQITCIACERVMFFSSQLGPGRGLRPSQDGLWPASMQTQAPPDTFPTQVWEQEPPATPQPEVPPVTTPVSDILVGREVLKIPTEPLETSERAVEETNATVAIDEPGSDTNRCPKCLSVVEEGDKDCTKCGLHFANVGVTFHPRDASTPTNPLEAKAYELWAEVTSNWSDPSSHDRFVQYCHAQHLLELAAFQYRKVKELGTEQEGEATLRLNRIVELVQQQFLTQQPGTDVSTSVKRGKWFLLLILFAFGLVAFYVIWSRMSGGNMMQMQLP